MCDDESLGPPKTGKWAKYWDIRQALDECAEIDEMEAHRRALYLSEQEEEPNIAQIKRQAISKTRRKYGREVFLPG